MIELAVQIKNEEGTDKISVEMLPRDGEANAVEKDVLTGLFPLMVELLNGVLGGEGFRKMEKMAEVPEQESRILDKNGAPTSIPMNEEYLLKKGLIEPLDGPQIVDRKSLEG
jgi:hypothetical protein